MKLGAFDFKLPQRLIAQHPLPERDRSRLFVVRRDTGTRQHHTFRDLPDILGPEYFLVLNNTRVFPARLWARRPGKQEKIEILLVRREDTLDWLALMRPARKAPAGQELECGDLRVQVVETRQEGRRVLRFDRGDRLMELLEEIGASPLPPYIRRRSNDNPAEDKSRYQTVYAAHTGSIAAPTAGLHFTPEVFQHLEKRGVGRCDILLHISYGTFQPVRCEEIEDHKIEPEYFEVNDQALTCIRRNKSMGRRLVAVGTTTTRVLEHLARGGQLPDHGVSGWCDLFIYPGFEFRVLDALLTNFHLPRSSLFMLVCAFAGRELMLECYQDAVRNNYRFFRYGDCMLIL